MLQALNLTLGVSVALAAMLAATHLASPRTRVFLQRCVFVFALLAPLALLDWAPKTALLTLPVEADARIVLASANAIETEAVAAHVVPLPALLLAAYLLGAAFILVRCVRAHLTLSRAFAAGLPLSAAQEMRARTLSVGLGVKAPVRVRFSTFTPTPCAFGWLRPKVLIPSGTSAEALDTIFAHELCHVRSHDAVWLTIGRIACALHWFNPLIWMGARAHREDIELVCDDDATRSDISVDEYLTSLVQAARDVMGPSLGAAVMMSRHGLSQRVRALLARNAPLPRTSLATRAAAIVCGAAALVALSAGQLVASEPAAMLAPGVTAAPGNGLVFVAAPARVRVDVGTTGACWDDAHCVFERALGENVTLTASSAAGRDYDWSGCTPSADNRRCMVRIAETPAQIRVRLRR